MAKPAFKQHDHHAAHKASHKNYFLKSQTFVGKSVLINIRTAGQFRDEVGENLTLDCVSGSVIDLMLP